MGKDTTAQLGSNQPSPALRAGRGDGLGAQTPGQSLLLCLRVVVKDKQGARNKRKIIQFLTWKGRMKGLLSILFSPVQHETRGLLCSLPEQHRAMSPHTEQEVQLPPLPLPAFAASQGAAEHQLRHHRPALSCLLTAQSW